MKYVFQKLLALAVLAMPALSSGQVLSSNNGTFTKADTLRGTISKERSYDINYYQLDIKLDIDNKFISGSNLFEFTATTDIQKLQFDLFDNLKVEKVLYQGKELPVIREFNAVFIDFPEVIRKGKKDSFTVFYSGNPTVARRAPWDGGLTFSKDKQGKPWVGVSCQGMGASVWWPNKDHQSDEVDSMMISISVPTGLMNVSNGRLRGVEDLKNGYTKYNWFVSSPINNYNVTMNVADYAHFSDTYDGENGVLTLDYYVLKENLDKAKKQFGANVKPMFKVFENWFGPYAFYKDGYKLIDAPYLGMEHQSAVAYGNRYLNGYMGTDLSGTGYGLKWDYIIIHETGHEWFGNNLTTVDIADMWVHEGFTMYSEGLYVESIDGKEAGAKYIAGVRRSIQNRAPVQGVFNVNSEGSGDMYYKGANMIHAIRTVIDNDEKFREILRGLNKEYSLKPLTGQDVINYFNKHSGSNFSKVFDQYLKYTNIPVLEYKTEGDKTSYRWVADVEGFDMPIRLKVGNGYKWIKPETDKWKSYGSAEFVPDTENFYIKTNKL